MLCPCIMSWVGSVSLRFEEYVSSVIISITSWVNRERAKNVSACSSHWLKSSSKMQRGNAFTVVRMQNCCIGSLVRAVSVIFVIFNVQDPQGIPEPRRITRALATLMRRSPDARSGMRLGQIPFFLANRPMPLRIFDFSFQTEVCPLIKACFFA